MLSIRTFSKTPCVFVVLAAVAILAASSLVAAPAPAAPAAPAAAPAVTARPVRPDDLFRIVGDARPIRLVLGAKDANDLKSALGTPSLFAYTYADYQGNALASGIAQRDAATQTITLPPPPAAVVENGAFVEIVFPGLQQKIGLLYGAKPPAQPDEFFGLDGSFSWAPANAGSEERFRSHLTIFQQSGIAWNRDRFRWRALHPAKDAPLDFNTISHTAYRRVASEMGIKTLDTFHDTPAWLRVADPESQSHRNNPYPMQLETAAEDWLKIVKNYQPTLQALEVWNEPDYVAFGKNFPADQIMSFTKAVSSKLREAGLETRIVGGVFMALHAGSVMQRGYIENGLLDSSDVVSWHTYRRAGLLQTPVLAWRKLAAQMNPERAGIPVWITEMGFPWLYQKGMRRSASAGDIDSASELAAKATEYKALGIEKNFAFTYKWYNEGGDGNGYGMTDASMTPMRTMASWATAAKTLAHFDYIGDLRGTNARRARVFENPQTGKSIAVLYHPVNEKAAIAHFIFPENLPLEKVTGADGRVLKTTKAGAVAVAWGGGGGTGFTAPHHDGRAYLPFSSKPPAPF
ncbi:MAG: hypothetical protein LBK99_18535, partial [Opitutaceae bacterium]|nr:hypothetical protein [Opitutaceae bacterium]